MGIHGDQHLSGAEVPGSDAVQQPRGAGEGRPMELLGDAGIGGVAARSVEHRAVLPELVRDPSHAERSELLLQKPLRVLDSSLGERQFLAGDSFTLADLNVASILVWGKMARLDLSAHPNVARWLNVCLTRPAYRRVRERKAGK